MATAPANGSTLVGHPMRRFFRLLAVDKSDITYIYVYAIFTGLITLSLPLGIQAIIGFISGGAISTSWVLLIGLVAMGTTLAGILKIMQLTVIETLQRRIFIRSSFDFAYRLPNLKLESLRRDYPPELVNRFFDTLTIQKGLPKILMDFSTAVLQIFFGILLISFYHPFFVFFGLAVIIIVTLLFYFTGPKGLQTSLKESKYKYEVAHWLEELARTIYTFKLAGRSDLPLRKTDTLVSHYLDARKKHFQVLVFQYSSIVGFKVIITAGLLILGSILVVDNQINLGQFVAAEIVVILILESVEKLILSMDTIYDVLTGLEKIGAVTDLPIEEDKGLGFEDIDNGKGIAVGLKDLTYQFQDDERPTLDNLNLDIQPGERICIAGYNRAGKSTLVQLIAGMYDNFTGSLTYNNFPVGNLNVVSLRSHIGDHSPQEDIFKGSLYDNIVLGHRGIQLKDVINASESVGLGSFIRKLPDGYNTLLTPGGKNLPRSIVTKIIIARSIVSQPRLLAMEEPLLQLEQRDRECIADVLTDPSRDWTLVAVSNDPLLARRCDRIILMRDGKIIEEGSFEKITKSPHFDQVFKVERPAIS